MVLRATDSNGAKSDQAFSITVSNVNDKPTNFSLSANTVVENSAGAVIGTLSASDEDNSNSDLVFMLSAGINTPFEVSGNVLKLKKNVKEIVY